MGRKFHHQISKFVNNKQINNGLVCYSSAGIDVFSVALGLFLIFIVFGVVSSGNLTSLFTRCE